MKGFKKFITVTALAIALGGTLFESTLEAKAAAPTPNQISCCHNNKTEVTSGVWYYEGFPLPTWFKKSYCTKCGYVFSFQRIMPVISMDISDRH